MCSANGMLGHGLWARCDPITWNGTGFRSCVAPPPPSRTQRIMESIPKIKDAGGAGGLSSYEALKRIDKQWEILKSRKTESGPAPDVVSRRHGQWSQSITGEGLAEIYDVTVCGGTLGVFMATALALRGLRVAIVEKGVLRGREHEWNASRKELFKLVEIGVITEEEAEEVIVSEFNPNRVGIAGGTQLWVKDILNVAVSPALLIEKLKRRFLRAGGELLEGTGLVQVDVFDNGAVAHLDNKKSIVSRLVLDVMGNTSPIVGQIRWGKHPDGVCIAVGSCARGFDDNTTGDVMYSTSPVSTVGNSEAQLFWEAFPSGSGPKDRTTYMFTYLDASPTRPSVEQIMEEYWNQMPTYQGVKLEALQFLRVVFGIFPTYRDSPLPAAFDRVLQVGDASGIQSPLSFGGFGCITRHLHRLSDGIVDALEADLLDKEHLSLLNPYLPNLSGSWLLQKVMAVPTDREMHPDLINDVLSANFKCMERFGDKVLRSFLQDVIQFGPLAKTTGSMAVAKPELVPNLLKQVGVESMLDWFTHLIGLASYTVLSSTVAPSLQSWVEGLPKEKRFVWKRRFDAWRFGAGLDYTD